MNSCKETPRERIYQIFSPSSDYYTDTAAFIGALGNYPIVKTKKGNYYNIPCAFDIETTSFSERSENGEIKVAIMYIWMLGVNGRVLIGRTWGEFLRAYNAICDALQVSDKKRLCIYVHNLAYEFQFIRKWFEWEKVFALSSRKPVYARTIQGVEFRCSYILSGYSLQKVGEQLRKYHITKKTGDLDYTKPRHSLTPITPEEMGYCVNDVLVVMAYIEEKIENGEDITRIPMTKTGYVRKYCRNACFYDEQNPFKRVRYLDQMRGLRLSPDEYLQLKRAFQGGFTHCNPFCSGKVMNSVTSYDFTSSYPTVMIAEQFPISSSEKVQIKSKAELEKNCKLYCCLFDVEFIGLEPKIYYENYISRSRCWSVENAVVNNGRVVSADRLRTTITEQDYMIIKAFYTWDTMSIGTFRRYKKGYLPTDFVKAILKLYGDKTTLKGVDGKEIEYLKGKEMLNSCYGMAVTDIVRPEYKYNGEAWEEPLPPDLEPSVVNYNNSRSRFLFFPWGVWVTAYARRNLFTGIMEAGYDYVYSDTDSIKILNADKHMEYINAYNIRITKKLEQAMLWHNLPISLIRPRTIKGVEKPLGVWDYDGYYTKFKSLGAKRYMVQFSERPEDISITVSGLNKKKTIPWLLEKYGDKVFDIFSVGLHVPPEATGKMTHTYIDDEREGVIVDYRGTPARYYEKSAVHLGPADYSLSLSREYVDFLAGLEEID